METRPSWFHYFDHRFDMDQGTDGWWRFQDPLDPKAWEKRDKTMAVHFGEQRVRSFRTSYHGSILRFLMDVDGLTRQDAVALWRAQPSLQAPTMPVRQRPVVAQLPLPDGFVPLLQGEGMMAARARAYVVGRGFDQAYAAARGLGYCELGKYAGYLCLPCYDAGALVYWVLRDLTGAQRRYLNPPVDAGCLSAGEVVYNADALRLVRHRLYVTEGIFDALTLGPHAVATLGKEVTTQQMSRLLRAAAPEVIVPSDPGAYAENSRIFARLLNAGKRVKVLNMDALGGDVNAVGIAAVMELERETPWLTGLEGLWLRH